MYIRIQNNVNSKYIHVKVIKNPLYIVGKRIYSNIYTIIFKVKIEF